MSAVVADKIVGRYIKWDGDTCNTLVLVVMGANRISML